MRPPIRAAKTGGTDNEAAETAEQKLRLSSQSINGTPIPTTPIDGAAASVYATKGAVNKPAGTVHLSSIGKPHPARSGGTGAFLAVEPWIDVKNM